MNRDLIPVYLVTIAVLAAFVLPYVQLQPKTFLQLFLTVAASLVVGFFAAIVLMLPVLVRMPGKAATE